MGHVVAVMDAHSVMGRDVLEVLESADAEWIEEVRLFGDEGFVHYRGADVAVHPFDRDRLQGVDVAILGGQREVEAGAVAVRIGDQEPVVAVDTRPEDVDEHRGLVCVPDGPATAIGLVAEAIGARRLRATVMHPASVGGPEAIEELYAQHLALFNRSPLPTEVIGDRLAYNVLAGVPGCVGLEQILECPISVTELMLPLFGGTLIVLDAWLGEVEPGDPVRRLDAVSGIARVEGVQPAELVGDPAVRVALVDPGEPVRLLVGVDEVRRGALSLVMAAREIAAREAF